jgi:glycosyltransferase involved in cell wall biosynthesis
MKQVVHVINSLNLGGAERMLQKLMSDPRFTKQEVFTILSPGKLMDEMVQSGVSVIGMDIKRKPFNFFKLAKSKPKIIVAWLYHSCLFVTFYKMLFPRTKIIWNIRHSLHDIKKEKLSIRIILKFMTFFKFLPHGIIFNSQVAKEQHSFFISNTVNAIVIPNGFDPVKFQKSSQSGPTKRIGVFARFHSMKGHKLMLDVFASTKDEFQDWGLCFVGEGCDDNSSQLLLWIKELNLEGRVTLRGPKDKMDAEYDNIDILAIPSLWGEGFPNVLGEAMLMEKRCIVSDVGDSALILNDKRWVFQSGDPAEFRQKLIALMKVDSEESIRIGKINREHIVKNYSLSSIANFFENYLEAF